MSYSATQLAKKLDISRSYLYYLKDNGVVEVEINDNGRVIWNEEAYQKLSEYIKKNIRYFRLISSGYENNLVNLCAYYSNKHLLTQEENNKRKRFLDECYQENCFSSRWTGD